MAGGIYTRTYWVTRTGNNAFDGIIHGAKWGQYITYSFPDSLQDYQIGYGNLPLYRGSTYIGTLSQSRFYAATTEQRDAVRFALETGSYSIERFTNLEFGNAGYGTGDATIRFANSEYVSPARVADFPYPEMTGNSMYSGDVWIGAAAYGKVPIEGNYEFITILHELGHALGLKHPHNAGVNGFNEVLDKKYNGIEYTVMSYHSDTGRDTVQGDEVYTGTDFAQTFMMLDIYALQHLYGPDYSASSGNTRYSWDGNGNSYINGNFSLGSVNRKILQTIWDGGGTDTYDLSNYQANVTLDLGPGNWSVFAASQRANLGSRYAFGNVANALQWGSDTRSLIENAWGGTGNDRLIGNNVGNYLWGNNGDDRLEGLAGNDTIDGGGGQDQMWGGAGNDAFKFRFLSDSTPSRGDVINDMSGVGTLGGDVIDLYDLDANLVLSGNQAFRAGFTGTGGLATFNNSTFTELRLYVDSRAGHDATIWINDGTTVVAANYNVGDFVL